MQFSITAPYVAFLLAIAAPMTSADADWYQPQDKVAYGAASLYQTDPVRFSKSISYQLLSAGLPGFQLDLFPRAPTEADGWLLPGPPILVRGLNAYSDEYRLIQSHMDMFPYDGLRPCVTTEFQRQGPMPDLVEVALHETAHYVSYRLQLDVWAYGRVRQGVDAYNRTQAAHPESQILVTLGNVREDISDIAAILYIYSNYRDRAVNDAEAQAKADMRVAEYFDSEHETSASIVAARKAFLHDPKYGLTIVEATAWAARLVTALPVQTLDTRLQAAHQVHDPLLGQPVFEARLDPAYDRFRAMRNRFCGVG